MEIRFYRTGAERKELVAAVSEITGWAPVYQKAPTFAYVLQDYTIDKDGTLVCDERMDAESVLALLAELAARGFVFEEAPGPDAPAEEGGSAGTSFGDVPAEAVSGEEAHGGDIPGTGVFAVDHDDVSGDPAPEAPAVDAHDNGATNTGAPETLSIEIPLPGFTDADFDKLEKLVASKAALIKKAVGASDLSVVREGDNLCFSWFTPGSSTEEVAAYTQFVSALCEMAKKQRRVVAKEKPADSEKFAFRCFLLRLGFIGEAYASARKILLANLPGDGSFKSGKRKDPDESEATPVAANAADNGAESGSELSAGEGETEAHGAEHARVDGMTDSFALAEALADAELIYNVNGSFEEGAVSDASNE